MPVDIKALYNACNPSRILDYANPEDRKFYTDFSDVRTPEPIRELKRGITLSDGPACQLLTGHIGCGKSTELLRLKAELEEENYHVIYFSSNDDLEVADVDIADILLVIARKVSESADALNIEINPLYFKKLFREIKDSLSSEIDLSFETGFTIWLSTITTKTKNSPALRRHLREYLETRTGSILDSINNEMIKPVEDGLKEQGKAGLVIIADNLDRIDNIRRAGRTQPEYIFIDRGDQLKRVKCHMIYTVPLILTFSNDAGILENRFGGAPKTLTMIPVRNRAGDEYMPAMKMLRQMLMTRAFPDLVESERIRHIDEIFENPSVLNVLCWVSGGHIRNLLMMLKSCIQKNDLPVTRPTTHAVIREIRNDYQKRIEPNERELLKRILKNQYVIGESGHESLVRNLYVFEYQDEEGSWFGVNPLVEEAL